MTGLARATAGLSGQKYELGAMDCFRLIHRYLERRGVEMPKEFRGQTLETYPALFQADPDAAKWLMVEFVDSLLPAVDPVLARPGDVLLLQLAEQPPFLAIEAGCGEVLAAAPGCGAAKLPARPYKRLRAWRCK